ncbi:uncharacterized protein LOC123443609 [Hordeum vulgare subsp. vulgare]|uniref:uncharacterized protein LOC123443609 n=1 Tax=Hordeum vulgare subsp. vulgare TaxID=112509 RepID=UPI001D1A40E4|nr:uncharacterized protein LOC123443609 [Hordeum vulgare subsp. vulgare]
MDEINVGDASLQSCQAWEHIWDEGARRCCQHRACVDGSLHKLVRHVEEASGEGVNDGCGANRRGAMLPTVVRVDEVVGVDNDDAGDELVLTEMKGVDGRRGSGERAAAVSKKSSDVEEEQWRQPDGDAQSRRGRTHSVTKTGSDDGVPAPRETTRRIPQEVDIEDVAVDRTPRRNGPKGRRSGNARVGATVERPRGGGVDRVPRLYGLKRRRIGGARVGGATGTASGDGGDRVPRLYRPKGRCSGGLWVGATIRRTTKRRCCGPTGRRSGSLLLDRWRGELYSRTTFTGRVEAHSID